MEISEAIEKCKKYTQNSLDIWAIPSSYECEELRIAINTVLEELDNRIPRKDIEDKLNEFVEKSLLDIAETEKFKFEYTLDGLFAIKYGVIHVLKELLNKE